MDYLATWFADLSGAATELTQTAVEHVPSLVGAILLLVAGLVIGRLSSRGVLRIGGAINRLFDRFMPASSLIKFRLSPAALQLIGNVAFWLIVLFFITVATRVAGLDAFADWLGGIFDYLPTLLAGGLIILAGYLISALVRDLVSATLSSAGLSQSELFGAIAQGTTFLTAVVIGIDQMGVDASFLVTIVAIFVGAVLSSVALAFGLGARTLVSNLIGAHYLQQHFRPGQLARIGTIEGEILELTPTSVVLAGEDGRITIPAKVFNEESMVLLTPEQDDE